MQEIEIKRCQMELLKVQAAKAEQEFRIMEKLEEINRLKAAIEAQSKREKELQDKLKEV